MRTAADARYATTPDGASIAFQVIGTGAVDVLYAAGVPINGSALLDFPVFAYAQYLERVASFSRLAIFDPRGSGRSDPLPTEGAQSLDDQADELVAVLDAAGFEQAAVIAELNAGPAAIRLAAERPDRVRSLVLNMTCAYFFRDGDHPGFERQDFADRIDLIVEGWGTGVMLALWNPEIMGDERLMREMAQFELLAASPARVRALLTQWGRTTPAPISNASPCRRS